MEQTAPVRWDRIDWWVAVVLFVGLSSLYFATASGITSSNDGSHYALTRTLVENHAFTLNQFDDYAEGNDIAVTEDGRLYSDRPPGTALAASLFYAAGGILPAPLTELPSRHDASNPQLLYVLLLPVFAGAGTVVAIYALLRMLDVSRAGAFTACVMFATGTAHWKYSSVLFSHALSALLVLVSVLLSIYITRKQSVSRLLLLLLGLVLGAAVLVEYANGLLVVLVVAYVLVRKRPLTPRHVLATLGPLVAGGLVAAAFLAFYNATNFGSPFTLSYAYAINYPWAGRFSTTFSYPMGAGLRGLLLWGSGDGWCGGPPCPNQGLALLSPILVAALPGWVRYWRQARWECVLTTVIFLTYLLLFARHRTFHGFTADGRYLVPFLGLLAIPLAYALEWLLAWGKRPLLRATLLLATYGLYFLSVRNMMIHIGTSYNYTLDLGRLDVLIASPANWAYLASQIWPNAGNLPLLWLLEVVVLGALLALIWLQQRRAVGARP